MWPGILLALLALFTSVFVYVYRRQREMIEALRRAREKIQLEETRVFDFLHGLGAALTAGGLAEAAKAARPVLEQAAEVARERASKAAEAARPAFEQAVEVARERASTAAAAAQARLEDVASDGNRPILVRLG